MNTRLSIITASLALLSLPLAIWIEDNTPHLWQERLALPRLHDEPNRHTPQYTEGTYLPPLITSDLTLTPSNNPVILTNTTQIPAHITVTIEPGTLMVAHEFAVLEVGGHLIVRGTADQPVVFTSNELNPDNKTWGGLLFMPDSSGEISQAIIEYASPALTCLGNSRLTASSLQTRFGLTGLYTESSTCTLHNSRLQAIEYGVVAVGVEPNVQNVTISAGREDIRVTEKQ